jgi:hypothetical protein
LNFEKRFEDSKDLKPQAEVQILQWSKEQKDKRTNNDLQNIAQTNQDRSTRNPPKTLGPPN